MNELMIIEGEVDTYLTNMVQSSVIHITATQT